MLLSIFYLYSFMDLSPLSAFKITLKTLFEQLKSVTKCNRLKLYASDDLTEGGMQIYHNFSPDVFLE